MATAAFKSFLFCYVANNFPQFKQVGCWDLVQLNVGNPLEKGYKIVREGFWQPQTTRPNSKLYTKNWQKLKKEPHLRHNSWNPAPTTCWIILDKAKLLKAIGVTYHITWS